MTKAQTILSQLGGNKFLAMTGAKNLIDGGAYLQFDLPRGAKNKANKVRINLDADDTYTVKFFRFAKLDLRFLGSVADVYASQLCTVFVTATGLEVAL